MKYVLLVAFMALAAKANQVKLLDKTNPNKKITCLDRCPFEISERDTCLHKCALNSKTVFANYDDCTKVGLAIKNRDLQVEVYTRCNDKYGFDNCLLLAKLKDKVNRNQFKSCIKKYSSSLPLDKCEAIVDMHGFYDDAELKKLCQDSSLPVQSTSLEPAVPSQK
jgi:hypothetical protein